jgi:hypothetical protein
MLAYKLRLSVWDARHWNPKRLQDICGYDIFEYVAIQTEIHEEYDDAPQEVLDAAAEVLAARTNDLYIPKDRWGARKYRTSSQTSPSTISNQATSSASVDGTGADTLGSCDSADDTDLSPSHLRHLATGLLVATSPPLVTSIRSTDTCSE